MLKALSVISSLYLAVLPAYAQEPIVGSGVYVIKVSNNCVATPILLTTTGAGQTWNNNTGCTTFTIEMIGGGGSGASGTAQHATGGGGARFVQVINVVLPAGNVGYNVGLGGASVTGGNGNFGISSWICSSTANCSLVSSSAVVVCASNGGFGSVGSGNTNGGGPGNITMASLCPSSPYVETIGNAGGRGGNLTGASGAGSSGGGGAGGENGAGNQGVDSSSIALVATNGGSGDAGAGGAAGVGSTSAAGTAGGNGTELTGCSWGSGGGGGASSIAGTGTPGGGAGGQYGGGGGAADNTAGTNPSGAGQQGAICIIPQGGTGYTGPLDLFGGAKAWYGVRAYGAFVAAAGTQKLFNIRRASDSEQCDVLVATSGGIGLTTACTGADSGITVASFCNATTCFRTKAYDQTGNGADASQATAAQQPKLVLNCIGAFPCAQTVAASGMSLNATITSISQPYTLVTVSERTANTGAFNDIVRAGATPGEVGFNNSANNAFMFAGGSVITRAANDNVWHSVQAILNGASSILDVDDTSQSTSNPGAGVSGTTLAIDSSATNPSTANTTEEGFYPFAFTGAQLTAMCRNQQAAYGAGSFGAAC